jgi:hypothetical protein
VVYPTSTEDVVKIVNVARKYRMPIVPYSGGTSLEGHFTGVRTRFCVASVVLAIIAYSRCVSGRAEASAWTCLKWTRSSRFTVRSPSAEYRLSNFLPSTQRKIQTLFASQASGGWKSTKP